MHVDAPREPGSFAHTSVRSGVTIRHALRTASLLLLAAGCSHDDAVGPLDGPVIRASAWIHNPHNVISALVTVEVGADSVAVRYTDVNGTVDERTPAVAPVNDAAVVAVFGLLPDATHDLRVVAWRSGLQVEGPPMPVTTAALPADLPGFSAGGPDPAPGYVVFAMAPYGLVLDNTGRVVWYHRFPDGIGLNFQAQPNGRYVALPPPASPSATSAWLEIDPLGNTTRTLGCVGERRPRFHDMLAQTDGSYWILCDESRAMNLAAMGGHADALVTGTVVQHVSGTGELLFEWSAFDHFDIADLDPAERAGAVVNWTHGNALDLDADGNLLLSFRNLSEVTKVDTRTGRIVWRLGGRRNEFTFIGSSSPPFHRQHGLRVSGPNELLLLDNLGEAAGTRVERYAIDAQTRSARLVASYASAPAVLAQLGGTTQPLPGERVLASFGSAGRVEEYDAAGNVLWRIHDPGYVFRAQRIRSLHAPGTVMSR